MEEAKTMGYVTNHNMITMAMVIFKTYRMADKGEERVLTETGGAGSEVWNRVYMIAPVKKFGRVRLSTNLL